MLPELSPSPNGNKLPEVLSALRPKRTRERMDLMQALREQEQLYLERLRRMEDHQWN